MSNWYKNILANTNNVNIDISDYKKSLEVRYNSLLDYLSSEQERLLNFPPKIEDAIKMLNDLGFKRLVPILEKSYRDKDYSLIDKISFSIHKYIMKNKKDSRYNEIRNAYKKVRDLSDYVMYELGEGKFSIEEVNNSILNLSNDTYNNMLKIRDNILSAICRIDNWHDSKVTIYAYELDGKNDISSESSAKINIGDVNDFSPSFSYFVDGNDIIIDDILEFGDTDFFTDNNLQEDYFNLVKEIRNPGSSSKRGKVITLYTARPSKDRNIYLNNRYVPSGIFLTNKYDSAEGIGKDFGERDIWRVRIDSRYLLNTLDSPYEKQYQVVGGSNVPVYDMQLLNTNEQNNKNI